MPFLNTVPSTLSIMHCRAVDQFAGNCARLLSPSRVQQIISRKHGVADKPSPSNNSGLFLDLSDESSLNELHSFLVDGREDIQEEQQHQDEQRNVQA